LRAGSGKRSFRELAEIDPAGLMKGEQTVFPRIEAGTLEKLHRRAQLSAAPDGKAYRRAPISFPASELELFFDIEVDPIWMSVPHMASSSAGAATTASSSSSLVRL
jgi:hypothetical protein